LFVEFKKFGIKDFMDFRISPTLNGKHINKIKNKTCELGIHDTRIEYMWT